jgi:hypothetical protein
MAALTERDKTGLAIILIFAGFWLYFQHLTPLRVAEKELPDNVRATDFMPPKKMKRAA